MLSLKEVQHIAKLARIGLSDEELAKFQKDLTLVLEYFEILREIDVSKVEPKTHAVPLRNVTRQDIPGIQSVQESQRLLQMVSEAKDNYVKIKSVL